MTSSRFPGKVLAPLMGRPLISHVVSRSAAVVGLSKVVILTSGDPTDDPLVCYAERVMQVQVFRGDLRNVLSRFQGALLAYPCERFVRVCGDSPFIDSRLIESMIQRIRPQDELVTNVQNRTFPSGQSVEILKSATFEKINSGGLSLEEQEHVTTHYYANPERYIINSIQSVSPILAKESMVVDTLEDLIALEEKQKSALGDLDFSVLMDSQ